MQASKQHIAVKIYGELKEQGLRFSTMHEAYKTGVKGIAKYTLDRAVYIEAVGYPEQLEKFKTWCLQIATKYASEKTEINYGDIRDYTEFNIID